MESFAEYEHLQIEEVCRICLTKKSRMNLIYETGLAEMLLEIASVQVSPENGLFSLVCLDCHSEVSRWYVFRQQVKRSFEIGQWLLDRKSKNVHIETDRQIIPAENISIEDKSDKVEEADSLLTEHHNKNYNDSSLDVGHTVSTLPEPGLLDINTKSLVCAFCQKQCTTTSSYKQHIKIHNDCRPYVCCKCDKAFKTSQVLAEHVKRHYDDRRYQCELCARKFYSKASLNDHKRSHTGEKPFKCLTCERAFSTRAILRQHMVVHTVREKKYQCTICSKLLLTAGSLETHEKKHSGIKPFPCAGCDKSFFTKEAMQRHFGAIHDTSNNFLCSMCSKVCSTKVHLNNHMKKKHLGLGKSPDAVCAECGKQCGSAAELKVHVRVHTGERPFVCDVCNKGFIARGNLNSHRRRHSGKKPFLCNHCGKAFGEKSTLKVHERIHTGEQPYKCDVCEKAYVQSSALRTHMKTHMKQ